MGFVFALTLPALVLLLTVLGVIDLATRRRQRRGSAMASTGFDLLQEALYPSKRYEIEQRESESIMDEEDGEGAPPRSHIDAQRGTAHIRLP